MSVITIIVATTITMSGSIAATVPISRSTNPVEFRMETINTIVVRANNVCRQAQGEMSGIRATIEGTKVARVLAITCSE